LKDKVNINLTTLHPISLKPLTELHNQITYQLTKIFFVQEFERVVSSRSTLCSRRKNFYFSVIDVGGQRSERRKWIHCFQDVTAVLYCVDLSGYDRKLFEDETVNRMHESLQLFKDIVNGDWFSGTAMILFLNKRDIFQEKIKRVPLKICFEDYDGENNYDQASDFIAKRFKEQSKAKKEIFMHLTCATDTDNIKFVFAAVKKIILNRILIGTGVIM